jgi:putative restriction endonuclease
MAHFWVNQGKTYADEKVAGLLWAPERTPAGGTLVHWETMALVQPGDVIFTYSAGALRGYAVATSSAVPMARPYAAGASYSPSQGGRAVFCAYTTVTPAVPLGHINGVPERRAGLQAQPNPVLDINGAVAQKYLCQISAFAADQLAGLVGGVPAAPPPPLPATTVQRLQDARVGQGQFRSDLLAAFGAACAVTHLQHAPLLRASHIKPWAASNNQDRLDPNNGLLLAAGVDAAFDNGYIGFDQNGRMIARPALTQADMQALGIPAGVVHLAPTYRHPARMSFLAWHRQFFGL